MINEGLIMEEISDSQRFQDYENLFKSTFVPGIDGEKCITFRFKKDLWNDKLIELIKEKAFDKVGISKDGEIFYSYEFEDFIANELISSIRSNMYSSWQVVHCPADCEELYRNYMTKRNISFEEEIRDEKLRFVIHRSYRPHSWKLA